MDVGEMLELVGYFETDFEADEELGIRARRGRGARRRPPSSAGRRKRKRRERMAELKEILTPVMAGVPRATPKREPLGFDIVSFVSGGPTADETVARPQKPIRGNRLLVDSSRTLLTGSTTILVQNLLTVNDIKVGVDSQLAGTAPLAASGFRPDAVDTVLSIDAAVPGIDVTLFYAIGGPALAAAEQIDVSAFLVSLTA